MFLGERGEALAQQLPCWKLSLPGHEESFVLQCSWEHGENCCSCSLVPPGCDFCRLGTVRLGAEKNFAVTQIRKIFFIPKWAPDLIKVTAFFASKIANHYYVNFPLILWN